jgi:hypothetical protein
MEVNCFGWPPLQISKQFKKITQPLLRLRNSIPCAILAYLEHFVNEENTELNLDG